MLCAVEVPVKSEEDHHASHDGTNDAEQDILAFLRFALLLAGGRPHIQQFTFQVIAQRQRFIQILLDNQPGLRVVGRVSFIDEDIHRDLDTCHPLQEAVHDGAHDGRADGQRGVLIELDDRFALLDVRELFGEIGRDNDRDLGLLAVYGSTGSLGVRCERDLDQVCHFVALEDVDDQVTHRLGFASAGDVLRIDPELGSALHPCSQ